MNTTFEDLQDDDNPRNGEVLNDPDRAVQLLEHLRSGQWPMMCQFTGENGYNLIVGVSPEIGCVQHSPNDGLPPYLMAVGAPTDGADVEYADVERLVGGTPTEIDARYRLPTGIVNQILATFVATGERSDVVTWEELE